MCAMSDPADEAFVDHYLEKPRPLRQGLPAAYRMRADAHYVDELESRRRPPESAPPALAFPTSIPVTFALRDMSQELEGVASCFNLVVGKARPLRERLGLSLARVGVQRNMRAFQALRALLEDPSPELCDVSLNTVVEQTVTGFDEELRVIESRVALDLQDGPIRVSADARLLSIAVQGCVGMLVAMIEASGQSAAVHVATRLSDGIPCCEFRQDTYRMTTDQFARLVDLEWSERPGGIPAGIALAAAARVAQSHGGAVDARRTESGGCTLTLSLRA
jgi:hypothetical protein